jgi:hypothetical protein
MAEGIIGGNEEPGVEALLDRGEPGHIGLRVGVKDVVNGVGAAGFVGEPDRSGSVEDDNLVAGFRDLTGGERRCGRGDIIDHLDALIVDHVAGDIGGKVRLVEMVRRENLDLAAQYLAAEIRRRHFRGGLRARTGNVGIKPGHVEDAAELERRLILRERRWGGGHQHHAKKAGKNPFHANLPADPGCQNRGNFYCRNHAVSLSQRQVLRRSVRWNEA